MLRLASKQTRGRMRQWHSTADAGISFSPTSIAGLQVWLSAGSIAAADGDAIATWADQSGNGRDATQSTSASRPLFKTNIFPSGAAGLRFDGTDDSLTLGDISSAFPTAASLFVVAKPNSASYTIYESSDSGDGIWRFNGSQSYMAAFRGTRLSAQAWALPSSGSHLFTITSSAAEYKFYLDGTQLSAASASFSGGGTHRIGYSVMPPSRFTGEIGEVIVYNRVLTNDERVQVESYLRAVYGIS